MRFSIFQDLDASFHLLQNLPSFAARFGFGPGDQGIEHQRNKFLFALGQFINGFQ